MLKREEVMNWLYTIPEGSGVCIDADGLKLLCDEDEDTWLEVGDDPTGRR